MAEESVDSGISSELYTTNTDHNQGHSNIDSQLLAHNNNKEESQLIKFANTIVSPSNSHFQFYQECTAPRKHVVCFGNYPYDNSKPDCPHFSPLQKRNNYSKNKYFDKHQILKKLKKTNFSSVDSAFETSFESTLSLVSSLSGSVRNLNLTPKWSFQFDNLKYTNFCDYTNFIGESNRNMTDNPNKSVYQDYYTCDKQSNRYNLNESKNVNPRVHFVPEEGTNKTNLPGPSRAVSGYSADLTGGVCDQSKMLSQLRSARDYVYMPTNRTTVQQGLGTCNTRAGQLLSNWQRQKQQQQQQNQQQSHLRDTFTEGLISNLDQLTDSKSRNLPNTLVNPYFQQQTGQISQQQQQTQQIQNQQQANYQQLISALLAAASVNKSRVESQPSFMSNIPSIDSSMNQQKFIAPNRWSDSELAINNAKEIHFQAQQQQIRQQQQQATAAAVVAADAAAAMAAMQC
ncbi:unnamed protein product [Trichobilharzia szidati]|nr:unnamed protein product [Trichobilharzia szidati]